jgi:anti-anti-sigma factor
VELIFEVQGRGEQLIVRCRGQLVCGHEAEALRATMNRLFKSAEHITLDLSSVRKMDCAGLGALVACMAFARQHGKQFELCFIPSRIWNMITVTGLHRVLAMAQVSKETAIGVYAA